LSFDIDNLSVSDTPKLTVKDSGNWDIAVVDIPGKVLGIGCRKGLCWVRFTASDLLKNT
jgi:hypothetical protein